jgi:hypothetical protein
VKHFPAIIESRAGRALEPIVERELRGVQRKSSQLGVMSITLAGTGAVKARIEELWSFPRTVVRRNQFNQWLAPAIQFDEKLDSRPQRLQGEP